MSATSAPIGEPYSRAVSKALTGRSTSSRTVAATKARKVKGAQRLAVDLAIRLPLLSDEWLCELARVVMREVSAREAGLD